MKTETFVAFGCLHAPLVDPDAIDWLVELVRETKPTHLVCLGDLLEGNAASRWADAMEANWKLETEITNANQILKRLRKAAGRKVRCHLLQGNHDANLLAPGRLPSNLRDLCDWTRRQYSKDDAWINEEVKTNWGKPVPYIYCRNRGVLRLGQITFSHGYDCSVKSDMKQAIKMGTPFGLFCSAHTHRPVAVSQAVAPAKCRLPFWYANPGCLRNLKPNYMIRADTSEWGQGAIVGEFRPVRIGATMPTTREWDARLEVFQMYDGWDGVIADGYQ